MPVSSTRLLTISTAWSKDEEFNNTIPYSDKYKENKLYLNTLKVFIKNIKHKTYK